MKIVTLKIKNLILIDSCEIHFGPNLNILTGETGSGKSAVLSAIRLIAGERADSSLIRNGTDVAVIEAELEDSRLIRREIYRSGKNRCFIDDAQVSLLELKAAVQIELLTQNSSILNHERRLLDLYANIQSEEFETSKSLEKELCLRLEKLLQIPKDRELEWAKKDLELIEEIDPKEDEEEKLSLELNFLNSTNEISEKVQAAAFTLTEGPELYHLKRVQTLIDSCVKFDIKLQEIAHLIKGAVLELEEAGKLIQSYADKLESDPNRLNFVEKRLSSIIHLKKRFGADLKEHKKKLTQTIDHLSNIDSEIESVQNELQTLQNKNLMWAEKITAQRKKAAPIFAKEVLKELRSLNIPHAQFEVLVHKTFNEISFLFSANPGHPPISIEACASGGELSRLLLAIKTILAEGNSTLVFDEIDSNVGGQTAAVIGEKLKKLAKTRQLICVTHFVQVAKCSADHFLVFKEANEESTFTRIQKLKEKEKEIEYNRMMGSFA